MIKSVHNEIRKKYAYGTEHIHEELADNPYLWRVISVKNTSHCFPSSVDTWLHIVRGGRTTHRAVTSRVRGGYIMCTGRSQNARGSYIVCSSTGRFSAKLNARGAWHPRPGI